MRKIWRVRLLKRVLAAAERKGRHGRAVIRLGGRDHPPPRRLAAVDVVSACQPQCCLVRLRTAGTEADARHLRRRHGDEQRGELLLWLVGEVIHVEVRDPLGLSRACLDNVRGAVAEI